jgi:hypothetical protein
MTHFRLRCGEFKKETKAIETTSDDQSFSPLLVMFNFIRPTGACACGISCMVVPVHPALLMLSSFERARRQSRRSFQDDAWHLARRPAAR